MVRLWRTRWRPRPSALPNAGRARWALFGSISLPSLRDTKHALKLATTHGSMSPGVIKRRRHPITGALPLQFAYPEVVSQYYRGRHAVDDNLNNLRQGSCSLEARFEVRSWVLRQFIALIAISEVNALCYSELSWARRGVPTRLPHYFPPHPCSLSYQQSLPPSSGCIPDEHASTPIGWRIKSYLHDCSAIFWKMAKWPVNFGSNTVLEVSLHNKRLFPRDPHVLFLRSFKVFVPVMLLSAARPIELGHHYVVVCPSCAYLVISF